MTDPNDQRSWLQDETLERQLSYWREQLQGAPTLLSLPTNHSRPAVQSMCRARHTFELSPELNTLLMRFSEEINATLFMTLLAAFQTLLYRYTGQADSVVGTPVPGSSGPQPEEMSGGRTNLIVLRTSLAGNPQFTQLLERVRDTCLNAYAHQALPFERLVAELQPEPSSSYHPLVQVLFAVQPTPQHESSLTELVVNPGSLPVQPPMLDLGVMLRETPIGLAGAVEYNTDILDAATVERLVRHYQNLLQAIVADPQQRLSALPLLDDSERGTLLGDWNNTAAAYDRTLCLHQLVERQAARTPQAVALVHGNCESSYGELNARANQLARRLRGLGIGPEVCVGVCMQRTDALIVALLGVLKTGAAYLPLDPAYPAERLRFMLEDTQAPVLLTDRTPGFELPPQTAQVLELDAAWSALAEEATDNLRVAVDPANLAYLIYTSGSTGRPKGVAIAHHSAVALVAWAQASFSAEELRGVLAATSVCFDLSIYEIFVPLSIGGTIVLAENALALPSLPAAERVTLINTVPSVMAELLQMAGVPASVQTINLAGEPLSQALAQQIYAQTSAGKVYNLYGPSEDTTYSTWALISADSAGAPPIGRPLWDTRAYVLDEQLQPVPIGVSGQLYLSGAGLARGYIHRPDLTAERFLPDPFAAVPGARMYTTGDLVRYRADGSLQYLERLDHQVKLRGFRIELGEIEAALLQHEWVQAAVVIAQRNNSGEQVLVAYVVPHVGHDNLDGSAATLDRIRPVLQAHLQFRLPQYMLPSAYVVLERLPLTANGKIDRRALPAPQLVPSATRAAYVAPRTSEEALFARVWAEILGVDQVGIWDSFFDLGGHSLLATRILSRLKNAYGIELSIHTLFAHPTIADIVAHLQASDDSAGDQAQDSFPLQAAQSADLYPISFNQQQMWFLEQVRPNTGVYNVPLVYRILGPLSYAALQNSINEIIRRHEPLRTALVMVDWHPAQQIQPPFSLAIPCTDITEFAEEARSAALYEIGKEEAAKSFDLTQAPLFRARLVKLADEEQVLYLTFHHAIVDGWSLEVFAQELSLFYNAFLGNHSVDLGVPQIQFKDYVVWQRQLIEEELLEDQQIYWMRHLLGAPALSTLQPDRPRPAMPTFKGAQYPVKLPQQLLPALQSLCHQLSVTPFMVLFSGLTLLLSECAQQSDIVVGSVIAGRNRTELEGLVGFFANTVALRTTISDDMTGVDLINRARHSALGAYAHQDYPFMKVVEDLQPKRDLSYNPLFQVVFVLQNAPAVPTGLTGLTLEHLWIPSAHTKFDLTLELFDLPGCIEGWFEYNTELYTHETIEHFAGLYQGLITALITNPQQEISTYLRMLLPPKP